MDAARTEIEACERGLSRFRAASGLSRLNRHHGAWVGVDERLLAALRAALRLRDETNGAYDPTILPALAAAGYDRSFEELEPRSARPLDAWRAGASIELDPVAGRARLEPGTAVDLGGIGKGFAAARALNVMHEVWRGLPGALVDLGGDIAVAGTHPRTGRGTSRSPTHGRAMRRSARSPSPTAPWRLPGVIVVVSACTESCTT